MKKMLFPKAMIIVVILLLFFGLASCEMNAGENQETKELSEVLNFKIENGIVSFDEVEGATKYRIELENQETKEVLRRFVEQNTDLNTLGIPEGRYMVKIEAMNDNALSKLSDAVSYTQKDLYLVNNIEGNSLIDGKYIKWMGRTSFNEATGINTIYYTAGGFSVNVKKVEEDLTLTATLTATNYNLTDKQPYVVIVLDDDFENTITKNLTKQTTELNLIGVGGFEINDENEHKISLYKRSESIDSHIGLKKLETSGKFIEGVTYKERKIEVIAASSSTGYGNLSSTAKTTATSDGLHAFAFLTSLALNSEISIVSASGWGVYASRWTTPNTINMHDKYFTTDCLSDEVWDTSKYIPDVVVVNFGTNDLSYINLASNDLEKQARREAFISTYVDFLSRLHNVYPNAQIIILYGLMNESGIYADHDEIFERAQQIIPNIDMIKINGDAQGYNSHPSVASHKTIAEKLTERIRELTGWE